MSDMTLTPYETAASMCDADAITFEGQLFAHACGGIGGYVFISPTFFIMGRPVVSSAPDDMLRDLSHSFTDRTCDAWLVWLAAGDVSSAMRFLPWELPHIVFHRQGEFRKYETERFRSFLASGDFAHQSKVASGVRPAVISHGL